MTVQELVLKGKYNRDERRYEKSYKFFLEAALEDDPIAIKNLGTAYIYEEGVCQDFEKGFHYLRRAYDLSKDASVIWHVMAIHDIVIGDRRGKQLYREFIDYLIDRKEWSAYIVKANEYAPNGAYPYSVENKIECYEKAISHGLNVGADCLGEMFFLGKEVGCDYKKAYDYFQSYQGFESFAKPYYLGRMYESGLYVVRNLDKARKEYRKIVNSNIPMRGSDVFYIKAAERLRNIERNLRGGT